jgi:predicted thioredoxin/glutaredoxin
MSTQTLEVNKDVEEVVRLITSGSKDPEAWRRVRERADRFCEEMRKKYGVREIAVDLVREARDEA